HHHHQQQVFSSVFEWSPGSSKYTLQVEHLDIFYWLGLDWPNDLTQFFTTSPNDDQKNIPIIHPDDSKENSKKNDGSDESQSQSQCYCTLKDLSLNYFPRPS